MARCWAMLGEGKVNFFGKSLLTDEQRCILCSKIKFKGEAAKVDKISSIEFVDFISNNNMEGKKITYSDFFAGASEHLQYQKVEQTDKEKEDEKKEEIEKSGNSHDFIELENSKTEYKFLRPNLLIPALRILSENKDADYPQKLFEIGTVFSQDKQDKTETGIQETENLIIIVSPANFTEMKQILNHLTKMLNLSYILKEAINKDLIEGRTAQILINNKPIGYLGDIYPKTLNAWGIKMPVAVIEISLEEIFSLLQQN